jgi:hypothetical protein
MIGKLREFVAIVWRKDSEEPGRHETFLAHDRDEARAILEEKYGKNIVEKNSRVRSCIITSIKFGTV